MQIDLAALRGLRFPDAAVMRMFFKAGLHRAPGRVLELGCGSGNNLLLFRAFGWEVAGIDIDAALLADARHNLGDTFPAPDLRCADLVQTLPDFVAGFDALLLPNLINYLPRAACEERLCECALLLRPGGMFFLSARTPQDWRYGRGRAVEAEGFVLDTAVTGEQGLLNVFYDRPALLALLTEHFGPLDAPVVLHQRFDNPQGGEIVSNDDIVVWGRRS